MLTERPLAPSRGVLNLSTESRLLFRHSGGSRNPVRIVTWIPFFNGMTDAVRHLDAGGSLS
jgi:hypothetical protein